MSRNFESFSKEELIEELKKIKKVKKYGLVWEDKTEDIVEKCRTEIPVLNEIKNKEVFNDVSQPTNLLIEGDNYHALSVLNYTHKEKIDLIYIDPPYNTGNNDFLYNDKFIDREDSYKHSKWISFINKRLILAKDLLTKDGSIFVSIDDIEFPRLLILMEDIFGEQNVKTICIKMSEATGVKMASVIKNGRIPKIKEYLIIAKKNGINNINLDKIVKSKWDGEYNSIITNVSKDEINIVKEIRDNENRSKNDVTKIDKILSKWKIKRLYEYYKKEKIDKNKQDDFNYKNAWRIIRTVATSDGAKKIADIKRQKVKGDFFSVITPQKKLYLMLKDYNKSGDQPRIKILLADDYLTQHPGDIWLDIKTTGLGDEGGVNFKNGKKPLKLLEKIILTNKKKDLTVLDFFAGSGTTAEAVIKLNSQDNGLRKFILNTYNDEKENGKIIDEYCYPRITNSIKKYKTRDKILTNLKYYKTSFIENKNSDRNKKIISKKIDEIICIKENSFKKVFFSNEYKIFKNQNYNTIIIYNPELIPTIINKIKENNEKYKIYIFSLNEDTYEDEFIDVIDRVELFCIPDSIMKIYKKIFQ